jgi:hypothetical protein
MGSEERDLVTRGFGHSKQSRIGSQALRSSFREKGRRETESIGTAVWLIKTKVIKQDPR